MKLLLFLLLAASPASAQYYNFLSPDDDEWEASNGLMSPPGSLIIYYDSVGPMSFISMRPREVPADAQFIGTVYAKTCQYGIGIPIIPPTSPTSSGTSISGTKGNGSYKKTLDLMGKKYPGLRGVFDMRMDDQYTSILAVFRRLCTEITAQGFK